jgi:hypothetical protein
MTLEEYDAWANAGKKFEKTAETADEDGGPRLSLVPLPDQQESWPTDLLPPSRALPLDGGGSGGGDSGASLDVENHPTPARPHQGEGEQIAAMPFDGIPLEDSRKRLAGWSAERQREFLSHLAETGSVHLACQAARLSARGAYRLRTRSPAFARGWDVALQLAVGRLSAIAFDRALNGRIEQVYHEGTLVAEKRVPSDRLLTWLMARLDPKRFALPWEQRGDSDPQAEAVAAFPALLDAITDTPA